MRIEMGASELSSFSQMSKNFSRLYGALDFYVGGLLTVAFFVLSIQALLDANLSLSAVFFCISLASLILWRLKTAKRLFASAWLKLMGRL